MLLGTLAPAWPAPVLAALAAALVIARSRLRPALLVVGTMLVVVGMARASNALRGFDQRRAQSRDALGAPSRCSGTATIVSSPAKMGGNFTFLADTIQMTCDGDGVVAAGTVLRLYAPVDDLIRGDRVLIIAQLAPVEVLRNRAVDLARPAYARLGATLSGGCLDLRLEQRAPLTAVSLVDRARVFARRRIEATYRSDAAPMARALVLGENDLDTADVEAFRASGLSHILAVSGAHIVIAVLSVVQAIDAILRRVERLAGSLHAARVASAIGVPLAWIYADFAGSGGSVRRAAAMASVALIARALGRQPDGSRAFGLSLVGGAIADPLAVYDMSFGLSAAATAGLLVLSRPLQEALSRLPPPFRWGREAFACTIAATTFCAPWLILLSSSLSFVGVAANVVAVPIGEIISLPACLGHLLLSAWPAAEQGVALLGSASLLAVRAVARAAASLSWAAFPFPRPTAWQLAVIGVTATFFLIRRPRDRVFPIALAALAYLAFEAWAVRVGRPEGRLRISFLDVGQGDSALIDFPDGRAMVIDGGGAVGSPVDPGRTVLIPTLRAHRRTRVDVAVLTHPHPDHFIGLASALSSIQVGELWDNGQGEQVQAGPIYNGLLNGLRARAVPIMHPSSLCGSVRLFGTAELRVLAPCPNVTPLAHANDNSLVLDIRFGKHRALLVGDAEKEEEERLLATYGNALQADVLKVGHHGSNTSSSQEFLNAVRPRIAVVSCGVRNRFAHPSPKTLQSLRSRGATVLRTDRSGGVVWESDGTRDQIRTADETD